MTPARLILACFLLLIFVSGLSYLNDHYPDFDKLLDHLPGGVIFLWSLVVISLAGGFFLLKKGKTDSQHPEWTIYAGFILVTFGIALAYYTMARLPFDTGQPIGP